MNVQPLRAPVMGVDCAARNIGLAWPLPLDLGADPQYRAATIDPKKLRGAERLLYLGREFGRWLDTVQPKLVALEGYGFASKELATQAEAGGVIRRELAQRRIAYQVVAPPTLKVAITGNGRATKEKIQMAVNLGLAKHGAELTVEDDHQADAMVLAWVLIEALAAWSTPLHARSADLVKAVRAGLPERLRDKASETCIEQEASEVGEDR